MHEQAGSENVATDQSQHADTDTQAAEGKHPLRRAASFLGRRRVRKRVLLLIVGVGTGAVQHGVLSLNDAMWVLLPAVVLLAPGSALRSALQPPSGQVDAERRRLEAEVLGETEQVVRGGQDSAGGHFDQFKPEADDDQAVRQGFAVQLLDYYAYGLAQAKRSMAASLASSAVGASVLVAGVILALVRSSEPTASIVSSLAGVLTSAIGALFHRQASQAIKHMEGQSRALRQDMKAERDQQQAIALLAEIHDLELKAQLQAALILKFANTTFPPKSSARSRAEVEPSLNGSGPEQRPAARRSRRQVNP
ncbi:TRADD-N-associated membrane domain-containing protein [Streptomyces sp. NPDC054783]